MVGAAHLDLIQRAAVLGRVVRAAADGAFDAGIAFTVVNTVKPPLFGMVLVWPLRRESFLVFVQNLWNKSAGKPALSPALHIKIANPGKHGRANKINK